VVAVFVGDSLVARLRGTPTVGRPYAGAVVGTVTMFVVGIVPLVAPILSLFGFGAVIVVAWRAVQGRSAPAVSRPTSVSAAAQA
jgi:hypothetical protein